MISLTWSSAPYISTLFTIIVSILPVFFAASIMAYRGQEWVSVHTLMLWVGIFGFAVWAVIQFFFFYGTPLVGVRVHHPFLDPNSLGGLMNIGIFPALGLFFLAKGKRNIAVSAIMLCVFFMALVVTQSRGGLVSFGISALVFAPFALVRNPEGFPWKKLAYVVALLLVVPLIGNIYHEGALQENLVSGGGFVTARSMEDRYYLWSSTLAMIRDNPFLGSGLGSFYFFYPAYRNPLDRSDGFFAHMDPLQYGAEMGIMAPVLFYGTLICILLRTISAVRAAGREDLVTRLHIMAPFCGMLALTGHAHMNYHLYMPGMLIPLACMLAYWYMMTERALGDESTRVIWKPTAKLRWGGVAALAAAVLIVGGWSARATVTTYLMAETQKLSQSGDRQATLDTLKAAGKIAPGSYARYYEYEARIRVNHLWAYSKQMPKDAMSKIYSEAIYYLDEAEKRNPGYTANWDLRARVQYAVSGVLLPDGVELAKKNLRRVLAANPLATDSRIGLANIYAAEGDVRSAVQVMEEGIEWPRKKGKLDLEFLTTLAKLKLQIGDRRAAELYMKEAQARAKRYGMRLQ